MHVVVIGGSVAGLFSALALSGRGLRVTVLEADTSPAPSRVERAFEDWDRRGSPQTRHSHAFLARLHNLLRDRAPALLEEIFAAGATPLRFADMARAAIPDAEILPEDDEITLIACRRLTLEWVLRRHVERAGVEIRSGSRVASLLLGQGDVPHVEGVVLDDGSQQGADHVVDASGRRSKLARWLEAGGAKPWREESEPCGIFYSSRFYQLRDGAEMPVLDGPMGADLGYMKYGVFPGDRRSFSVTLAADPEDPPFRALFREQGFDALARSLPATAPWVDAAVANPISEVTSMTSLRNTRRFPVEGGAPLVTGLSCVGDALIHTNPIVGRGCTLAAVNAFLMADAVADHDDAREQVLALDRGVEREIVPWYEGVRMQDRDAIAVAAAIRRGDDPYAPNRADGSVDPQGTMRSVLRHGFLPALRQDVAVLRAFLRIFNLLDAPTDLMKDPAVLAKVFKMYAAREEREPERGEPSRDEVVGLLEAA